MKGDDMKKMTVVLTLGAVCAMGADGKAITHDFARLINQVLSNGRFSSILA